MRVIGLSAVLCMLIATLLITPTLKAGADAPFEESTRSSTSLSSFENKGSLWDISDQEYLRYKEIMAGRRGIWSPDADPIEALGTHARTTAEMRTYAEKHVKQMYARVERELAFQREVTAAWKRLYPNQPRIGSMLSLSNTKVSQNIGLVADRAAVVVTTDCQPCSQAVRYYLGLVAGESPIKAVDIFISDSQGDDKVLRDWVDSNQVAIALLRAGKVTVNHAEAHTTITRFPTIFERQIDGQWQQKSSF
ncbi:MAG: TIGR03759 family integrating conjugative element protein [Pseudomonadota bacterium]